MPTKVMPVERGFVVTDTFGYQAWRGGTHWGVDYGRNGGSGGFPVFAMQGGTVTGAGPASGFGQWVTIDHPDADGAGFTVYGHVIPEVGVGQRVEAGQRIARINPVQGAGNGNVPPHLHVEWHRRVWSSPGANRLDPAVMLQGALWPDEVGKPPPAVVPPAPVDDWGPVLTQLLGERR